MTRIADLCRGSLEIVGKSRAKAAAALLMDGSKSQSEICKGSGIDPGLLSRFMKDLRAKDLVVADEREPKLVITVPQDLFENAWSQNG
jgi:DNA-binding MarR family transcriptional regulator